MARSFYWLTVCLVAFNACGDIRIVGDDAASGGQDVVGDGANDTAADVKGDANGDVATLDATGGCTNDESCKGIKGKTPCKDPVCDKATGQCKLQARSVGSSCVDPFTDPVDCAETRCDGSGQCTAQPQADGTTCGIGACGKVCKSGVCSVATEADYDDKNPCTNDYCDQGKVVEHDPITNVAQNCDDGDSCTEADACVAGVCQGAPVGCSDNLDCTIDTCAKAVGCQHTPKLGVCSDGNPCTKDACDLAVGCTVVGTEIGTCDDGNACSDPDFCDKGVCKGKPSADLCTCTSDADCVSKSKDPCGVKYKCDMQIGVDAQHGVCVPKADSAVVCDTSKDGACLISACDPSTGSCATLPVAGTPSCDDGNACTSASVCSGGGCVGSVVTDCADKNPCTSDSCAGDVGCVHAPASGPCDDANPCSVNDACQAGSCLGSKKPCDDGLLCTFDSCESKTGDCLHLGDAGACNDDNPCTTDTCDLAADCQHAVNDAGLCDDGNVCTEDACKSGKCVSVVKCDCAVDLDCDDKNPCTTDVCQAGKCVTKSADGNACSSGDKCQKPNSGTCAAGACVAGNAPVDCSSVGDACNVGLCDASSGNCQAVAKPSGASCEDGNGCTESDVCEGGKCTAGVPVDCPPPADKPCQEAICMSTGASSHTCTPAAKPIGTVCDDGLFCSIGEQCDAKGNCVGTPFLCPSPSECLIATCSELQQACVTTFALSTQKCEDGLYCTVGDTCDGAGGCASGQPRVCSATGCQTGVCDEPTDQCVATLIPGCCKKNAECDDGFPCTTDTCNVNTCAHNASGTCCNPTLWADTFEGGSLGGVTIANSTGSLAQGWQVRSGALANGGTGALYYGNPATNSFNFGTASSGIASTPTMQVPFAIFGSATLDFYVWFDTENGNVYDQLTVSAVYGLPVGPQSTVVLWTKPQTVVMGVWQKQSVTLPANLWGQNVHFEFSFNTVDAVSNDGQGVYVDDISVQVPCL